MTEGRDEHLNVDHTVIWGEETHPRCETCGGGYQTATPDGIGYEPHRDRCPVIAAPTAQEADQ